MSLAHNNNPWNNTFKHHGNVPRGLSAVDPFEQRYSTKWIVQKLSAVNIAYCRPYWKFYRNPKPPSAKWIGCFIGNAWYNRTVTRAIHHSFWQSQFVFQFMLNAWISTHDNLITPTYTGVTCTLEKFDLVVGGLNHCSWVNTLIITYSKVYLLGKLFWIILSPVMKPFTLTRDSPCVQSQHKE